MWCLLSARVAVGRGTENNLCVGLSYTTAQPGSPFGREQPPTYFFGAVFLPAFSWQAVGTLPHWPMSSVTSPMYGPWREWALQHLGCTCNGCINIHLFVNINCPCCSELLQIIHIDSALLMIKYNVLQCLHLTGKLDWIYRFEVGWVVFSYVAGLFFFFLVEHCVILQMKNYPLAF